MVVIFLWRDNPLVGFRLVLVFADHLVGFLVGEYAELQSAIPLENSEVEFA